VLKLLCRLSLSADTCVSRTESVFGRWDWSSLVVGRFLPGVSLIAPPLAGALGMKWSRFLVLTGAGAALYGLVVIWTGMLLAAQIEAVLWRLDGLGWHALVALAVILALYVAGRWWWRRRVAGTLELPRVSVDELEALIATGEAPLVVDVRGGPVQTADPRQIPGAVAVALDAIETGRADLPRDRPIILYCACPNEVSAAKAARLLLARGYTRARPLRGGLDAWIAAGHGVEATPSAANDPDEPGRAELAKAA
jgi:rhodanese-related sulfurtransferase